MWKRIGWLHFSNSDEFQNQFSEYLPDLLPHLVFAGIRGKNEKSGITSGIRKIRLNVLNFLSLQNKKGMFLFFSFIILLQQINFKELILFTGICYI